MSIQWRATSPLGISNLTLILLINILIMFALYPGDVIVPSLPNMGPSLHASANEVQLAVSIFLFSSAIFQFIGGFLTSTFGPKKTLISSIIMFTAGSLLAANAHHIYTLWFGRFLQGIGAAAFLVMPRFYMKTCFPDPKALATVSGYSMMSVSLTVAFAPMIGGIIEHHLGWEWNFWIMFVIGIAMLILYTIALPNNPLESLQTPKMKNFKSQITQMAFIKPIIIVGLNLAYLMTYYTMSPFILEDVLHYSPKTVGIFGAFCSIPIFICSFLVPKLAKRFSNNTVITIGLWIMITCALSMLMLALSGYLNAWVIVTPYVLAVFGTSLLFPNCFIEAFKHARHTAIATGIYGTGQFLIASCLSALSAVFHEQHAVPMASILLAIATGALLLHILYRPKIIDI